MKQRLPRTREEWQGAVDTAQAFTLIHSAVAYGLIAGGPEIDAGVERIVQGFAGARRA